MNQSVHQAPYVISHMAFEWQTMVPGHACFNPDFPAWYLKVTFVIYLSVRTVITGNYSMSMLYKTIVTNDGQIEAVASMLLLRALHALIVCHPCLTESWNLKQSWVQRHRICELRSYFWEQTAGDDFDLKIKPPIPSHHPPMKANCQRFGSGRKNR